MQTPPAGRQSIKTEVLEYKNETIQFSANIFIVSAGAVNSAILLLKSANDKHPNGLANASGQVGRNFMKHNNAAMMGITLKKTPPYFKKLWLSAIIILVILILNFRWDVYNYLVNQIRICCRVMHHFLHQV